MSTSDDKSPKFLHRSWPELGKFYSSFDAPLDDFQLALSALGKLTLSIERSYLGDQLFAHTSHANLMICQTRNTFPTSFGIKFLVITPLNDGMLRFSINPWGIGEGTWSRVVKPVDLLGQFNGVLRKLGWISHDISA